MAYPIYSKTTSAFKARIAICTIAGVLSILSGNAYSAEPLGFSLYKLAHSHEFPETGPAVIQWSAKAERDILSVDRAVNRSMREKLDAPGTDVWRSDASAGDCEDFALKKRVRLIRMGYPPRALRIKVVTRFKPNDHAVLEVVTTRRRYVLNVPGAL